MNHCYDWAGSESAACGVDRSVDVPSVDAVLFQLALHEHPVDALVELLAVAALDDSACARVLSIVGDDKVALHPGRNSVCAGSQLFAVCISGAGEHSGGVVCSARTHGPPDDDRGYK
jgi:hypothetical protein